MADGCVPVTPIRIKHSAFPLWLPVLLVGVLPMGACDSATEDEDLPGTYETTRFTAQINGETVDVLRGGGFVELVLRENGTASGRLFVPAALNDGEETDLTFAGTYTVSGNQVAFDHEADTFIRDVAWTHEGRTLRADSEDLSVVLRKQD